MLSLSDTMSNYLHLEVPSSCQENWHQMVPEEQGRYCLRCQKAVVDFTSMSDRELIAYFENRSGATCGRFAQSQLNRDILVPRRTAPWVKHFFQFTLPAFLLSLKSSAQVSRIEMPIEISPIKPTATLESSSADSISLRGTVTNEAGVPLHGASIYIKGTKRGTVCDEQGHFTLTDVSSSAILIISSVGFESREVNAAFFEQGVEVKLQLAPALMGEVIVVGYAVTKMKKRKEEKISKSAQQIFKTTASILPYPNPVLTGGTLTVQCHNLEKGEYLIEFYTLSGQQMHSIKLTYGKRDSEIKIPAGQLPASSYVLRLTHEKSGKYLSQQVVVQH